MTGRTLVMNMAIAQAVAIQKEMIILERKDSELKDVHAKQYIETHAKELVELERDPPRRLTNVVTHRDYHPSYMRVGVRVDGVERNDIHWYDADAGQYSTSGPDKGLQAGQVEPYWRYPETRQQRRARERWERSRGA